MWGGGWISPSSAYLFIAVYYLFIGVLNVSFPFIWNRLFPRFTRQRHSYVWGHGSHLQGPQMAQWYRICLSMQEKQETQVWSLNQEDPQEEEMATHSSMLAWKIACTEEPDGQLVRSKRVGHDWATEHAHTMPCRSQPLMQQSPGCLFRSLWQEPTSPVWAWNADLWYKRKLGLIVKYLKARERGSNEKPKHPLCRSHRTIYSGRPHGPQPNVSVIVLYVFFGLEEKSCLSDDAVFQPL